MRAHQSKRAVVIAVALAMGLVGCASSGSGGGSRPAGATSSRIVSAELEPLGQINPLRAIERLRPQWLRTRSGDAPILHVDGGRRSSLNEMNSYQLSEVDRIEYMSASDATTRFGTGYSGGAILLFTK
ncbi:MAG: hypothetical protein HKN72_04570 [Gemmatimonadetes bacterium]|nr:hypothetical protein [Gemmatimonadota bacterium]